MSDSKICFKCKTDKPLTEYYVHAQLRGGRLNKCIECTKKDVMLQREKNMKNPDWVKKEAERARKSHTKLKGADSTKARKKISKETYYKKYPEKRRARWAVQNNLKGYNGYSYHHWCYRKEFWLDVILLPNLAHAYLHRFITYVPELMCYKTKLGGILLDTKERHLEFIDFIQHDNTLRIAA
jgi:hypothetical protein